MVIQLRKEDKDWIKKAVELDMTRLQVKKKLAKANYDYDRIDTFLDFYDIEMDKKMRVVVEMEESTPEEEEELKENVKKYFNQSEGKLGWKEKRLVKRFLSNTNKSLVMMQKATNGFIKELDFIKNSDLAGANIDKELEYLKVEIINSLINSKILLDIEHPKTKEEITKENLMDLNIDELIELMNENVDALDMIVNGKIIT